MEEVRLMRTRTGEQGTFGVLAADGFECCSLELPWKDNLNSYSCIPTGRYPAIKIYSSSYGHCYWLREVPGRSEILIHTGNLAGDVNKGWETHSEGCILLGEEYGILGDQEAVFRSRKTLRYFLQAMDDKDFILYIKEMW